MTVIAWSFSITRRVYRLLEIEESRNHARASTAALRSFRDYSSTPSQRLIDLRNGVEFDGFTSVNQLNVAPRQQFAHSFISSILCIETYIS